MVAGTDPRDFMKDLPQSRSGRLLHNELGRRWPADPDHLATIVRYALLPAGKLLRPIMTLESAEAVGGHPDSVLPAALSMEYIHVATLVHDDIIDADELRRGRPAVPVAFGTPAAIVAGDQLIFTAFASLTECHAAGVPADRVVAATDALATAGADLCRGQLLESQLVDDPDSGVAAYLEVARLKTGALFRAVCQVGALLGGADATRAGQLANYGEQLGIAFQIRDDLLAYEASTATIGKPTTSDLANGRPTLPVLLAYETSPPATRAELTSALHRHSTDPATHRRVHDILRATRALERAREQAGDHARQARDQLHTLPDSASRDVLTAIARWATAQSR
ncbi:geranylgeranyl diphosphate synthase type I [Micromonospora polyrhachis]|uniref:Geranylgeranyl diphosphate synthase type I n=1 Tax=Micromonospora polyrhachis TaxID=1282883 RepID=A0A7W7SNT9_9ACTN|nr:polyprenyl synthetase family protein [Micromonospora polyrhachis]MBB4956985.1 geranylgeranyl diphosphate synthase type I [Micromonospora polyrhachis]